MSFSNLGRLMRDLGDIPAARLLLERGLSIRERALGTDHIDTASTLHNLSLTLLLPAALFAHRTATLRADDSATLNVHDRELNSNRVS